MRVLRQVIIRADRAIGEIAAPAARNPDPLAELLAMVDQHDTAATETGLRRAHHAGSAGANDQNIGQHQVLRRATEKGRGF